MIKITLPLVDELHREKRGIVVPRQTEGASKLQLYQITGSGLSQSQRNTTDRQKEERRGEGQKNGGQRVSCSIHRSDQDQFIKGSVKKEKGKGKTDSPF